MPQSLAQIWLHLVFSTKDRRPWLQEPSFRNEMFQLLAHHVKQTQCLCASVGGYIDHVHLLVALSRTLTVAKLIERIKTETSKWAKKASPSSSDFSWQAGYGAFSVSHSICDSVVSYIENQERHHARISFQDEFRLICQKHNVLFDERFVWD